MTTTPVQLWTWHPPPKTETPLYVRAAINRTGGDRRMFGWFNGDYRRYTQDVQLEIWSRYAPGEPVCLTLQHWMQKAHTGNHPSGIDPWGMFTHVDDRTAAGLPGIWPEESIDYWHAANDHLFGNLKAMGINVAMLALDTEVTPRGGPYKFEGTHEAIVADPRWDTEPLRGFGKTAAQLIPPDVVPGTLEFDEWIRLVGQHSFAHAFNGVLNATAMVHYPEMLISDFTWHDRKQYPSTDETRRRLVVRAAMVAHIMQAMDISGPYWMQKGVGNAASPSWKGQQDLMGEMQHADELIEMYGADRVVPWITDRMRMNTTRMSRHENEVDSDLYRRFMRALRDPHDAPDPKHRGKGIRRFLLHPADSEPLVKEAIDALEEAFD